MTQLQAILIALALIIVGLLIPLIIIGLARGSLTTTGVVTMLGGLLAGIVGAISILGKNGSSK